MMSATTGSSPARPPSRSYNGFVFCYRRADGLWDIELTDNSIRVYGTAMSSAPGAGPLLAKWRNGLGPAHPEHLDDVYQCTAPHHDIPASGQLEGAVLEVNVTDNCFLFSDGGHIYEIDVTDATESKFSTTAALMGHLVDHLQHGTLTDLEVELGPEDQVVATSIADAPS